jgi:hypothetical protein
MGPTHIHNPPIRIADLIELNRAGAIISCSPAFKIIPVDFAHRTRRFQALVFICWFAGTVDAKQFIFRKCYARGSLLDEYPRISLAIMIANHYLQKDYHRLEQGGIKIEQKLFTLEEMSVQLMNLKEHQKQSIVIDDYIEMAKGGLIISANVSLEYVPATEHFEYHTSEQMFLFADFIVEARGEVATYEHCLGCYPAEKEKEEKPVQIQVANDRLSQLYREFDLCSFRYEKRFFA